MASFLSWLYGVADRVTLWFGNAFAILYAGAYNAWTWAVSQAQAAYLNAKSYAFNLYQGLISDISGLSSWVSYQLDQLKTTISGLQSLTYQDIIGWISAQLQPVYASISSAYNSAVTLVNSLRQEFVSLVRSFIGDAIASVYAGLSWISTLRDKLIGLVTTLTPSVVTGLVNFFSQQLAMVNQFLSNPVQWIMDVLQTDMISAICWLIAIGLGATSSDLPNTPPWRKK